MKKLSVMIPFLAMVLPLSAGCAKNSPEQFGTPFDASQKITVVSRESGSGTRGAFVELMDIEEKDAAGNKVDRTTDEAIISNSTSVVMTSVHGDLYAIGYISLGSLNDTVKALKVDGASASAENIKNGTYKVSRPFNIAAKGDVSVAAKDFIDFIMSRDGQKVVESNGYIPISAASAYSGIKASGKIVVAGSSSVTPVMEKLKEAYEAVNPNAEIEIQMSDSSTGMNSAINGTCDIGMASRELKDSELEKGLTPTVIAMDGIAVIVNPNSTVSELTHEQIKSIFVGDSTRWSQIVQ